VLNSSQLQRSLVHRHRGCGAVLASKLLVLIDGRSSTHRLRWRVLGGRKTRPLEDIAALNDYEVMAEHVGSVTRGQRLITSEPKAQRTLIGSMVS